MSPFKCLVMTACLVSCVFISGCENQWGTAGLGAAGGAVAAGGGYEYVINREMNRIEEAYNAGQMGREEFEIRKDQIQRMSILE